MRNSRLTFSTLVSAMAAAGLLAACGGGGGGGGGGGDAALTGPSPVSGATMTMSCADGASFQCSGDTILRTENGIGLTASGVQVYGKSTVDLITTASGFELVTGPATAELRVQRDVTENVKSVTMLLDKLGLSWDGQTERPPIIEPFLPSPGRSELQTNGSVKTDVLLPQPNVVAFYDFGPVGTAATQRNYANNRYFPRLEPSRCTTPSPCATTETVGIQVQTAGNWRTAAGREPDVVVATRLHSDGDVNAGDLNAGGTLLPGANGHGVTHPGTRGYRNVTLRSYRYANSAAWISQDTININEWAGPAANEHNKNRRGIVTFGAVTDPAAVPSAGSATYTGVVNGLYSSTAGAGPDSFHGDVEVTVNFAVRSVTVLFKNIKDSGTNGGTGFATQFETLTVMGGTNTNVANYFTGAVGTGTLSGGLSGRMFGPVAAGLYSPAPAELGGTLRLTNSNGGGAIIGGFLVRRD